MLYKVDIVEKLRKRVIVEADNADEAEERARDAWSNSECVLMSDDFDDVDFEVVGETDGSGDDEFLDRIGQAE